MGTVDASLRRAELHCIETQSCDHGGLERDELLGFRDLGFRGLAAFLSSFFSLRSPAVDETPLNLGQENLAPLTHLRLPGGTTK